METRPFDPDIPAPRRPLLTNGNGSGIPVNGKVTKPGVSLVIPTKNEATNVAWVLEQIPDCVDEIVLVDGHSSDATLVTARSCRADLRVIAQEGFGKGDALRSGFMAASGEVIVMIDADGSMAPQEIPHFLHFLANGYDFVKGSRFIGGGGSLDITRTRRMGNKALLQLVNTLYGANLTDLCYGFCAFKRRYLPFLDVPASGFEIETQLTICALQSGLRIAEVPSLEMPRRHGKSNLRTFRDGTRVLRTILREHQTGISGHVVQAARAAFHGHPKVLGGAATGRVRPSAMTPSGLTQPGLTQPGVTQPGVTQLDMTPLDMTQPGVTPS
ncbi:MAG: glycosyltransferase family 2 protein [Pseudonocardia sp.]